MPGATRITVMTVTFNAMSFLEAFFQSLMVTDQKGVELDIVLIDNGSTDGTVDWIRANYPTITVLENDENNYTRALNLGIANSCGEYVAITNNDAIVHPGWLQGFLPIFQSDEKVGAVQSKLCFSETKKINSVGVQEVGHFYFADIGFDMEDSPRYAKPREREYVTGGSVMFRRACLEDVGEWDEDFIMFMEDVDYSTRCRKRGWKLWYSPSSIIYHQYHGSSSMELCDYFCTRNRFFFAAKHFPLELAESIPTSHFYQRGEIDNVYRSLLHSVQKMCAYHDTETVNHVLKDLESCLPKLIGDIAAYLFFSQLEVLLGLRKIRVGIYDHTGHFAGEGQRYAAEMAAVMQERYDVQFIFNNDVELSEHKEWFDLDLSKCSRKIIKIPLFEERNQNTGDEGIVLGEHTNPFDIISRETLNYDIFVNANTLEKLKPLSPVSIFICHFPDRKKTRFFQVDNYDHLVVSSDHIGECVKRRWDLEPTTKIYPPVNMYNAQNKPDEKEKMILSISRFEVGGSKKQIEMIQTYSEMCRQHPEDTRGWKLVLLGGSTPQNTYMDEIEEVLSGAHGEIEYKINTAVSELKDYYQRASIFWHSYGLDKEKPERMELFGTTTVEAMQNYCVPIVFDGGGQREIVEHGDSGFLFSTLEELMALSLTLMRDHIQCRRIAGRAYLRGRLFDHCVFTANIEKLLADAELQLLGHEMLPGYGATT